MAFCTECGRRIEGNEKFCTECGTPVVPQKTAQPVTRANAPETKAHTKGRGSAASAKKRAIKDFGNVKFKWSFRDYQQAVLDNAAKHLKDKRIHIVAAPGSGKTILGLELVRRLGKPALVMSPSVTIRQQWGERFADAYMPEGENADDYISYNLTAPGLITSITYQALHAAFTKGRIAPEADEDELDCEEELDFSDFELLDEIKKAGITTVCLDEAHHLKSEWQKALEKFVELLGDSVNIIALTATPPYDSTPGEWNRYISLCGDIDEEIFVPQLVMQKTLCPHQDYVYFCYPTKEELALLEEYKNKAALCAGEIINGTLPGRALKASGVMQNDELLYDNIADFAALTLTVQQGKTVVSKSFCDKVFEGKKPEEYSLRHAERAFNFIISKPEFFGDISDSLKDILAVNGLIEKKKVCLCSNDKLNKLLVSSQGKLNGICDIAKQEYADLSEGLRMLILTDYIKKEVMPQVGTDAEIHTMGTVPVFETLRRSCPDTAKIAVLTGTLVILPKSAAEPAREEASAQGVDCRVRDIPNTDHCEVMFSGSNKNKVAIITKIFGDGRINILIGTKSLLGEGWDSPNINSLILASFVGSFMLSNQMRGRAIRIDKTKPDKISNIWHLVTVDPSADNTQEPGGGDYETLKRRFDCFQAPAYSENSIESGTERLDIIKPPFDEAGVKSINNSMFALAGQRKTVADRWNGAVGGKAHPEITEENDIPAEVHPAAVVYKNRLHAILLGIGVALALLMVILGGIPGKLLGIVIGAVSGVLLIGKLVYISNNSSPEKSIRSIASALQRTLKEMGEIESGKVLVNVNRKRNTVSCSLTDASAREKAVFARAVSELLSPIDDPRYILVSKGCFGHDWSRSYACPAVIGKNKKCTGILTKNLKGKTGNFDLVFTRNAEGRKALFHARKYSYINLNSKCVKRKKTLR